MPDLVCICGEIPDPWCDVHPFKIRTTPTRLNEPRPLDDPVERCPAGHDHAGGRCWTPNCDNAGSLPTETEPRRYLT